MLHGGIFGNCPCAGLTRAPASDAECASLDSGLLCQVYHTAGLSPWQHSWLLVPFLMAKEGTSPSPSSSPK